MTFQRVVKPGAPVTVAQQLLGYGTPEGVKKAWNTRGRGRKAQGRGTEARHNAALQLQKIRNAARQGDTWGKQNLERKRVQIYHELQERKFDREAAARPRKAAKPFKVGPINKILSRRQRMIQRLAKATD